VGRHAHAVLIIVRLEEKPARRGQQVCSHQSDWVLANQLYLRLMGVWLLFNTMAVSN
jgi:hypothetical protein